MEEVGCCCMLSVFEKSGRTCFHVWVQPKASRKGILGLHGNALKVQLTAPPVDNQANQQLLEILAKALGVSRTALSLTAGMRSKNKTVAVCGISPERLRELLEALLSGQV